MTKKKSEELKILSDRAILFIDKYAIPTLGISSKIDDDIAMSILDFALDCEINMVVFQLFLLFLQRKIRT